MKRFLPVALLLTVLISPIEDVFCATYKLSDALKQGLVTAKITGAPMDDNAGSATSSHWGPCMQVVLTCKSTTAIAISMEHGYLLMPEDTNIQTMLVTQDFFVNLAPGQNKTQKLYAMCSEASDGSPSAAMDFKVGKRSTGNLLNIAALISKKNYQADAGQSAVWCISDKRDLFDIYSSDTTMMYDLRRFVAKAIGYTGSIYDAPAPVYQEYVAPPPPKPVFTYSGNVTYNVITPKKVFLALFDEQNHMKKVFVNNEYQKEGTYTYKYQISSADLGDKPHSLKLVIEGKIEQEIELKPMPQH
jgi:hypothetical protein